MSATNCAVAVEQATEQYGESSQQVSVPCCCTVAQAARSGLYDEIKRLVYSGMYKLLY